MTWVTSSRVCIINHLQPLQASLLNVLVHWGRPLALGPHIHAHRFNVLDAGNSQISSSSSMQVVLQYARPHYAGDPPRAPPPLPPSRPLLGLGSCIFGWHSSAGWKPVSHTVYLPLPHRGHLIHAQNLPRLPPQYCPNLFPSPSPLPWA